MTRSPLLVIFVLSVMPTPAAAEELYQHATGALMRPPSGSHSAMTEDNDGVLSKGEYEVISPNGSITRALCPYTCEMRGIQKDQCRTWASKQDPSRCYVQDTTIASNAVPLGPPSGKN